MVNKSPIYKSKSGFYNFYYNQTIYPNVSFNTYKTSTMSQTNILLYDGVCNLCIGWVQFIIKNDRGSKFKFVSLQSLASKEILKELKMQINHLETVVYIRKNEHFTSSTAVLEILGDLGGFWKVFLVFKLIPKKIRDLFYKFIAANRYKYFGKRNYCYKPFDK